MLTGEYFVLDGAKALAFPTVMGQSLEFKTQSLKFNVQGLPEPSGAGLKTEEPLSGGLKAERENDEVSSLRAQNPDKIYWRSLDHDNEPWFETEIDCATLASTNQNQVGQKLEQILRKARELNPDFLLTGGEVTVKSDFNLQWGFGSSSTLVSLVAQWAQVDAYQIQFACFGGSGYDIACTTAAGPVLYQRWPQSQAKALSLHFPFSEQLYFVYLGQKQNSRDGIKHYREMPSDKREASIAELNKITEAMLTCNTLEDFGKLLQAHEQIVGEAMATAPVKERLFADFDGQIKSLGAWGGDFVLAASRLSEADTHHYFKSKGYPTILRFSETVC